MFWIIFATAMALLGGLAGFTIGDGHASALAFTIVGFVIDRSAISTRQQRPFVVAAGNGHAA